MATLWRTRGGRTQSASKLLRGGVGHSYSLPTIKILFGTAKHCAYPGCTTPLIFEDRGRRTVAVQIAHIRSAEPGGPRHDPDYDQAKLNTDENLLLLCNGPHHYHVDQHDDAYTVEELLEWKNKQASQGGGYEVTESEISPLVQKLDEFIAELRDVVLSVGVRGGLGVGRSGLISMELSALATADTVRSDGVKYLGVRAENHSLLPATIESVGVEFDIGHSVNIPYIFSNNFTQKPLRQQLGQRDSGEWFAHQDEIHFIMVEMGREAQKVPTRFRAFVQVGSGVSEYGPWESATQLPIWKEEITEDELHRFRST